jgi:hypothetical protein
VGGLVVLSGVAAAVVVGSGVTGSGSSGSAFEHLQWGSYSGRPIPVDVNGDGTDDIVGWIKLLNEPEGKQMHLAAFDGKDGKELWRTPSTGSHDSSINAHAAVIDDRLLVVDGEANATAYDLDDGKKKWEKSMGERAKRVCVHDDDALVELADETRWLVSIDSGKKKKADPKTPCTRVWGTHSTPDTAAAFDRFNRFDRRFGSTEQSVPAFEGMTVSESFPAPGNLTIALGTKDKGTRIPMVGVARGEKVLWNSVVPEEDAMKAQKSAPDIAAADGKRLYVAFDGTGSQPTRIAAFELESGDRLWERDAPHSEEHSKVDAFVPMGKRLAISHWTWLTVLSAKSGKEKLTVGRWR